MFSFLKNKKIIIGLSLSLVVLSAPIRIAWAEDLGPVDAGLPPDTAITVPPAPIKTSGLSSEEWITVNKNQIEQDKANLEQPKKDLEELKKAQKEVIDYRNNMSWTRYLLSPNGFIKYTWYGNRLKTINRKILSASEAVKHLENDITYRDKQIHDELIATAKTPEEKKAAQDKYNELKNAYGSGLSEELAIVKEEALIDDSSCYTITGGINLGNCILRATGWIGNIITWVFALLLWVASKLFDMSVYMSISMIHSWFLNENVANVWKVMRDFSNIFFIFILLYIALGTIFDLKSIGSGGGPQKMIIGVIIVALLVNFSGFFVRVVVDASNIVAYEFYKNMGGGELEVKTIGTKLVEKLDLGSYFITSSNLSVAGIAAGEKLQEPKVNRLSFIGIIGQTFGNVLIILGTTFVLLVAAILFIIRTITLLFLYVVSPLAITSQIIPKGSISSKFNKFDDWLNKLLKESFYAPAFLVPLYIVFTILGDKGIANLTGANGASGWGMVGGGSLTLVMIDILILGLIIGCLFVAQAVGAGGVNFATGAAKKATQLATRPISRYGGRMARGVGRGISNIGYGEGADRKTLGQFASDRWQNGAVLGRVRQSWDTGLLREARQTKTGQVVGQAVRNPLVSAGAGLGKIADTMGVKGMADVFGTTSFSEVTKQRADEYLKEMNTRERPEDQARYLEGLAGITKREEFSVLYSKMGAEQRRKLESSATTPALKARLVEERKGLKGKAGQDMAVEMVNNSKGADKASVVEHLSQDDLNTVYKNLKANERVELEKAATGTPLATKITEAKTNLATKDAKAGKETERESLKQERISNAKVAFEGTGPTDLLPDPITAFNPTSPEYVDNPDSRIGKIRELSGKEFAEFVKENNLLDGSAQSARLYPYLTREQLTNLLTLDEAKRGVRRAIKTAVNDAWEPRGLRPVGSPHPDDALDDIHKMINSEDKFKSLFL